MAQLLFGLKIIGIEVLCLILLILLLGLLLLFAPFKYRIDASYQDNKPDVKAKVRFLFPLVWVTFFLSDTLAEEGKHMGMKGGVYVLGIRVKNLFPTEAEKEKARAKKKRKQEKEERKKRKKKGKSTGSALQTTDFTAGSDLSGYGSVDDLFQDTGADLTEIEADEKAEEKGFFEKLSEFFHKLPDVVRKILEKAAALIRFICSIPEKTEEAAQTIREKFESCQKAYRRTMVLLERDYTKSAIEKIKKAAGKLLRALCPKKGEVVVGAGFDDIATTGQIAGYYGMLIGMFYPFIGKRIVMVPDFTKKRLEVTGYVQGNIRLCSFLRALWLYFFDKDIKRLKSAARKIKEDL
ncbi:MAG: DUF2953 domain-containing protein [Lachnospiraceae bacterium]|nr:DUF2953 domain-containing protein [Lachnospiraceae bacterium]